MYPFQLRLRQWQYMMLPNLFLSFISAVDILFSFVIFLWFISSTDGVSFVAKRFGCNGSETLRDASRSSNGIRSLPESSLVKTSVILLSQYTASHRRPHLHMWTNAVFLMCSPLQAQVWTFWAFIQGSWCLWTRCTGSGIWFPLPSAHVFVTCRVLVSRAV